MSKIDLNQAFVELEEITHSLESGNLDLDTSLEKYERGITLAKEIRTRLSAIENRVKEINIDD